MYFPVISRGEKWRLLLFWPWQVACLLAKEPPHTTCPFILYQATSDFSFLFDVSPFGRNVNPLDFFEYSTGTSLEVHQTWPEINEKHMRTWQVSADLFGIRDPRDLQEPRGMKEMVIRRSINHLAWKSTCWNMDSWDVWSRAFFREQPLFTESAQWCPVCVFRKSANRGNETDVFLGHGTWPNPNVRSLVLTD